MGNSLSNCCGIRRHSVSWDPPRGTHKHCCRINFKYSYLRYSDHHLQQRRFNYPNFPAGYENRELPDRRKLLIEEVAKSLPPYSKKAPYNFAIAARHEVDDISAADDDVDDGERGHPDGSNQ